MSDFESLMMAEWESLNKTRKDPTQWDALVSLLKDRFDIAIITLKADFEIIYLIASGFPISKIARTLGIPRSSILKVAKTWSLDLPVEDTLDFNPIDVYKRGITLDSFEYEIGLFLPIKMSRMELQKVLNNVEKYYDLLEYLNEVEKEEDNAGKRNRTS